METATSFGGPFILLPKRLADEWSKAIGDSPEPDSGLYGEVCGNEDFMHLISFQGSTVVRIAEEPSDLFWIPDDRGGLVLQWVGADSRDDLVAFGQKVASTSEWQETLEFTITDPELRIMDSCGFDGDDQPKIDLSIDPGEYQISATYAEDENTMATVFRLTKKGLSEQGVALNTCPAASSIRHDHSTLNPQSKPHPRAGVRGLRR